MMMMMMIEFQLRRRL